MTTEPTISRLLKTGEAKVLVDLRTAEAHQGGARRHLSGHLALHGDRLGREAQGRDAEARQRLRQDAAVHQHAFGAPRSPTQMPKDYLVGDRDGYIKALDGGKGMFTPDGIMPAGGPETVLAVLSGFSKNVKGKTIDLRRPTRPSSSRTAK